MRGRKKKTKLRGITLLEFVIVISILALVLTSGLIAFQPVTQFHKAQDAQKLNDMHTTQTALDSYYNDHNCFPTSLTFGQPLAEGSSTYLKKVPQDPAQGSTGGYSYMTSATPCPQWNVVFVKLSRENDNCALPATCRPANFTPEWSCRVSGEVECSKIIGEKLPGKPTPTPTNAIPQEGNDGYALDETKLLRTYAFFSFDPLPYSAIYDVDVSFRNDFGGKQGSGADSVTYLRFAPIGNGGNGGTQTSISSKALRTLTSKGIAFQSRPDKIWLNYQQCGKRLYYRLSDFYTRVPLPKVYSAVIDCTTKVGTLNVLDWYQVYDQVNQRQKKYDANWDADHNGIIDWVDYWILAMNTKMRAGGWQPPE